jgi:hypothetical protein
LHYKGFIYIPFGSLAPMALNLSPFFKNSTISANSSFASSHCQRKIREKIILFKLTKGHKSDKNHATVKGLGK